jgi:hypothetical protein
MIVKHKKAPGQKFISRLSLKQRSWLNGFGGSILFSLGLNLFALSWIRIYQEFHTPTWIFMILLGLILTLGGILVMGKALILSSQIKARKYYKKRQNALIKGRTDKLMNESLKIERKKP